jgi:hypothetical protein
LSQVPNARDLFRFSRSDLTREERRAEFRAFRGLPALAPGETEAKPRPKRVTAPLHARCEHLPVLPEKRSCGGCWRPATFSCEKVGRKVVPNRDCGPACQFYEAEEAA